MTNDAANFGGYLPLNLLLMTSTKGHYGRHDIYKTTANDLLRWDDIFPNKIVHIKVDPDNSSFLPEMEKFFKERNYFVIASSGEWKHGDESHQTGYLCDLYKAIRHETTQSAPYLLFMEDDWLLDPDNGNFHRVAQYAIQSLSSKPDLLQCRIPRFHNEFERINNLMDKHGLDRQAIRFSDDKSMFYCNDWSNNPYFCRSRDLKLALKMIFSMKGFGHHAEHSVGAAMSFLSDSHYPFAVFENQDAMTRHIGTPVGQEDCANSDGERISPIT